MAEVKPKSTTFYQDEDPLVVDASWLDKLQAAAIADPLKRARLCLHRDVNALVHEMIIVFHRDSYVRPHRHHNKSESFHVIRGHLGVILFGDNGRVERVITMSDSRQGQPAIYRLNASRWHSVIVLSEWACIHEVTTGPYIPEQTEFAVWSPAEDDVLGQRNYRGKLLHMEGLLS